MNTHSFDTLTRQLATKHSRRQLLRGISGGAIGVTAIRMSARGAQAQSCAGIQESCVDIDCCFGYGCDENFICIAAAECADLGEGCLADEQCCGAYFCGETGVCIAAAECASAGQPCKINENCCAGLVCDESGACTAPLVDSGGSGVAVAEPPAGEAVTELPGTGSGGSLQGSSSASWLAGVAAAGAALIAGSRLRAQRGRQPVPARIDDHRDGVS